MTKTSIVALEHSFIHNNKKKRADIAIITLAIIKCIIEICHTHKTTEESRPEPWCDLYATDVLQSIKDNTSQNITFNCIRKTNCVECQSLYEAHIVARQKIDDERRRVILEQHRIMEILRIFKNTKDREFPIQKIQ